MRSGFGLVCLLLLAGALLAGCLDAGESSKGNGVGTTDGAREELPCHERTPPVATPDEQEVDSEADIRCLAHFAILDEGSGPTAQVPTWTEGDWWRYRGEILQGVGETPDCGEKQWNVTGETNRHETGLYVTRVAAYDCDGQQQGDARQRWYTQDSLAWMQQDIEPFIRHELKFPLADGKEWAYLDRGQDNVVHAEVEHQESFRFDGEDREVWQIKRSGTSPDGSSWETRIYFDPDARNALQEEFYSDGIRQYTWTLIDSVDGHGEGGLVTGLMP